MPEKEYVKNEGKKTMSPSDRLEIMKKIVKEYEEQVVGPMVIPEHIMTEKLNTPLRAQGGYGMSGGRLSSKTYSKYDQYQEKQKNRERINIERNRIARQHNIRYNN